MKHRLLLTLAMAALAVPAARSYYLNGPSWPAGSVISMHVQLGPSPALADGCLDWACSAAAAAELWNVALGRVRLQTVQDGDGAPGGQNGRNDMFFARDAYGYALGSTTLAVTTWWQRLGRITEADITFNSALQWDSYRGDLERRLHDLRRVAAHELGHVLGLGHPDEQGQTVHALMNSRIGNLDTLTVDDIQGVLALYGLADAGVTKPGGTVAFPPRDETFEFRAWLETKYRDALGRPATLSYTDVEGSVVWVQEYLRYRLNACGHEGAVGRVRVQIAGGGIVGACGTPKPGSAIAFPSRDQTHAFRRALEAIYRDDLGRAAVKTYVDAEGDVVWIQEYLRYRLNGCTHAQSVEKVGRQIDGFGVQPVCR